ncbi:MAG: hypothetical protein NVSMB6_26270 [Burkholderiaceae bacterium]
MKKILLLALFSSLAGAQTFEAKTPAAVSGTVTGVINSSGSTPTLVGPAPANNSANIISVTDNIAATTSNMGFSVLDTMGGSTATGQHTAFLASARYTTPGTGNYYYVGAWDWVEAAVTPTSGAPNFTANNPQCRVDGSVTGIGSCVAQEADVSIQTGGAANYLFGVGAALVSDAAVSATVESAAFAVWNGSPTIAWPIGLDITNYGGRAPISSTGTIIKTTGAFTVANGIDFSSATITGNLLRSANFNIDGNGNIGATTLSAFGTALANTNGAAFAVKGQSAGSGNQTGGNISLNPGGLTGTGANGSVVIQPQGTAGNTNLLINSTSTGGQSTIGFQSVGALKWLFGQNAGASPSLFLYDQVGGQTVFSINPSASFQFGVPVILPAYTVATLPTCNAANNNAMAAVSDATTPTYNGALTGGGAVKVPVYCNGTAWTSH